VSGLSGPGSIDAASSSLPGSILTELDSTTSNALLMSDPDLQSHNLKSICDALDNYAEQMKIDLKDNSFAEELKGCNSPEAILQLLEKNRDVFKGYRDKNRKFFDCLNPVVKFVHVFSGILGEATSLVSAERSLLSTLFYILRQVPFQPANLVFVGIDVLFAVRFSLYFINQQRLLISGHNQAAEGVSASYDALLELFECIGSFLKRLEIYTKIALSPLMTEIIVKIMVELLSILAQAKKQIKHGRLSERPIPRLSLTIPEHIAEQFAKKLLGDSEIENILRRLDRLTHDEARMMEAHILEVVHGLMDNMKVCYGW
jgi:hypothetical protein